MYQVRHAMEADFTRILEIYAYARHFMAQSGNPNQWGTTNPTVGQLEKDIAEGNLYLLENASGIHGVFAMIFGEDSTYGRIDGGNWHWEIPYVTIHRVASDGTGGVFPGILSYAANASPYIRIDTHRDNRVMQHVLEKHGFRRCGIIYLQNGDPRIAFDWHAGNHAGEELAVSGGYSSGM